VLPLVNQVDYALHAPLTLEKDGVDGRTDKQTDGRQTEALRFPLDMTSTITMILVCFRKCTLSTWWRWNVYIYLF